MAAGHVNASAPVDKAVSWTQSAGTTPTDGRSDGSASRMPRGLSGRYRSAGGVRVDVAG
jgi:hypothetical protein